MDKMSLWKAGTPETSYPSLEEDLEVDVAIIGGGITGVTAAYHLINAGKKVAIIEADKIGGVTTSLSTGNLYVPVQPYYQNIKKKFNEEVVATVAQSRKYAIDFIESTVSKENLDCAFSRRPWFIYSADEDKEVFLRDEIETIKKAGLLIEEVHELPLPFHFKKAARMENQARFNPYKYVVSLAAALSNKGCLIFENSRINSIEEKSHCIFKNENGKVTAKHGILATHTPTGINCVQLCTAPYRSYAIAVQLEDDDYPEGHFWDLEKPHHVTCTHTVAGNKPNLLIVSGNHHKTGQDPHADLRFEQISSFIHKNFKVKKEVHRWSAQHYHAADDVPYIGLAHHSKNVYLATGYFADGLTYGTLAGIIIGDHILEKNNPWRETYKASRFTPLASAGFVFKEGMNVFSQYLKDFPKPSIHKFENLKLGEAKIVEIDREKCGVYRDENNQIHVVSAVCPHMKCIVNWNNAEKTWDCPCHGSRFTPEGKVIEGPAQHDLEKK